MGKGLSRAGRGRVTLPAGGVCGAPEGPGVAPGPGLGALELNSPGALGREATGAAGRCCPGRWP